jgi:hypothetical protein
MIPIVAPDLTIALPRSSGPGWRPSWGRARWRTGSPGTSADLADPIAAGEPPGGLQPQPLPPFLLGGGVPASLPIPHASVIRP